jgi:hypothetical protein
VVAAPVTSAPPSTTTTTQPETTTSEGDPIGLLAVSDRPTRPTVAVVASSGEERGAFDVLVSLGSAFIDMAVNALSYYLLAFLAPLLMTILLWVRQRQEKLEAVET